MMIQWRYVFITEWGNTLSYFYEKPYLTGLWGFFYEFVSFFLCYGNFWRFVFVACLLAKSLSDTDCYQQKVILEVKILPGISHFL